VQLQSTRVSYRGRSETGSHIHSRPLQLRGNPEDPARRGSRRSAQTAGAAIRAALGDLDKTTVRLLDRIADDARSGKPVEVPVPDRVGLRPGTLLAREWEGAPQRVMVLVEGFAWNGNTYPSLSQVARAIAGTRWNGPRFFGLRDQQGRGG
jgi:hypothetical protein